MRKLHEAMPSWFAEAGHRCSQVIVLSSYLHLFVSWLLLALWISATTPTHTWQLHSNSKLAPAESELKIQEKQIQINEDQAISKYNHIQIK